MARYRVDNPMRRGLVTAYFDTFEEAVFYIDKTEEGRGPGQMAVVRPIHICPHNMPPHECDACLRQSDHLYDSDREDRMFGR